MHKKVPTRSSVLLLDGLIYMTTDAGVVSGIDAKTGAEIWHGRIDGTYSASPTYGDGKIYFCNESGKTTVLATGREFKVLAEISLPMASCPLRPSRELHSTSAPNERLPNREMNVALIRYASTLPLLR